jgi:hypothetical protein
MWRVEGGPTLGDRTLLGWPSKKDHLGDHIVLGWVSKEDHLGDRTLVGWEQGGPSR